MTTKTLAAAAVLAGAAFGVVGGVAPVALASSPQAPVIPGPVEYVPPTLITEVTVPPVLTVPPIRTLTPVTPTSPTSPTDLTPPPHTTTPGSTPPVITDPKFTPNPPTTSHTPPEFPKGAPETAPATTA